MKTKHLTLCGVLTAVALAIFVLEAQLPHLLPVPGVKPGLSNLITLFALLYLSPGETLLILLARIVLGALLTGNPSTLLYSLAGGLGCLGTELFLLRKCIVSAIWAISAVGAMAHNLIQTFVAAWMTKTPEVFWYLPFLLITGMLAGIFTGLCIQVLHRRYGHRLKKHMS